MSRPFVVAPVSLAFAVFVAAAPVPTAAEKPRFAGGIVTKADLDRLPFPARDPLLLPAIEERCPGSKHAALALYLPRTRLSVGEPVPAYFVVKHTGRREPLGLHMRLDLFRPTPGLRNSCAITLTPRSGGSVGSVLLRTISCGGGPLVEVPVGGYYIAKGDLGRLASGPLPAGEYDVSWSYTGIPSNSVRFAVVADREPPRGVRPVHALRFLEITERDERLEQVQKKLERVDEPVVWAKPGLAPLDASGVAAELGVGVGERFYPDLHDLPESDDVMLATAEWEKDRVFVTLRPNTPNRAVRLADEPHYYLLIASDRRGEAGDRPEEKAQEKLAEHRSVSAPRTVEIRLPRDWKKRTGVVGTARVAVLVSTKKIEPKYSGLVEKVKLLERLRHDNAARWGGVLRTPFTEMQFPE